MLAAKCGILFNTNTNTKYHEECWEISKFSYYALGHKVFHMDFQERGRERKRRSSSII
jgi:hypothetical protein